MEAVKQFESELTSLLESRHPASKTGVLSVTRSALNTGRFYKYVVELVERTIRTCSTQLKLPGLFVVDSIVRQSRHQFGPEEDVFGPRFARNLPDTFSHVLQCPPEDKSNVVRVLNLWKDNDIFESDLIGKLFDLLDLQGPTAGRVTPKTNFEADSGVGKESLTTGPIDGPRRDQSILSNQEETQDSNQTFGDVGPLQTLQGVLTLLTDLSNKISSQNKDKKTLDFDYGDEEKENDEPPHEQKGKQIAGDWNYINNILSNREFLQQVETLRKTLDKLLHQQMSELKERLRKTREMKQGEEKFDKYLAKNISNLLNFPFIPESESSPSPSVRKTDEVNLSQPLPNYLPRENLMFPFEKGVEYPTSALQKSQEGEGLEVIVLSDSSSDSPVSRRGIRRRSRSTSRSKSNSRYRSQSRSPDGTKRPRLNPIPSRSECINDNVF